MTTNPSVNQRHLFRSDANYSSSDSQGVAKTKKTSVMSTFSYFGKLKMDDSEISRESTPSTESCKLFLASTSSSEGIQDTFFNPPPPQNVTRKEGGVHILYPKGTDNQPKADPKSKSPTGKAGVGDQKSDSGSVSPATDTDLDKSSVTIMVPQSLLTKIPLSRELVVNKNPDNMFRTQKRKTLSPFDSIVDCNSQSYIDPPGFPRKSLSSQPSRMLRRRLRNNTPSIHLNFPCNYVPAYRNLVQMQFAEAHEISMFEVFQPDIVPLLQIKSVRPIRVEGITPKHSLETVRYHNTNFPTFEDIKTDWYVPIPGRVCNDWNKASVSYYIYPKSGRVSQDGTGYVQPHSTLDDLFDNPQRCTHCHSDRYTDNNARLHRAHEICSAKNDTSKFSGNARNRSVESARPQSPYRVEQHYFVTEIEYNDDFPQTINKVMQQSSGVGAAQNSRDKALAKRPLRRGSTLPQPMERGDIVPAQREGQVSQLDLHTQRIDTMEMKYEIKNAVIEYICPEQMNVMEVYYSSVVEYHPEGDNIRTLPRNEEINYSEKDYGGNAAGASVESTSRVSAVNQMHKSSPGHSLDRWTEEPEAILDADNSREQSGFKREYRRNMPKGSKPIIARKNGSSRTEKYLQGIHNPTRRDPRSIPNNPTADVTKDANKIGQNAHSKSHQQLPHDICSPAKMRERNCSKNLSGKSDVKCKLREKVLVPNKVPSGNLRSQTPNKSTKSPCGGREPSSSETKKNTFHTKRSTKGPEVSQTNALLETEHIIHSEYTSEVISKKEILCSNYANFNREDESFLPRVVKEPEGRKLRIVKDKRPDVPMKGSDSQLGRNFAEALKDFRQKSPSRPKRVGSPRPRSEESRREHIKRDGFLAEVERNVPQLLDQLCDRLIHELENTKMSADVSHCRHHRDDHFAGKRASMEPESENQSSRVFSSPRRSRSCLGSRIFSSKRDDPMETFEKRNNLNVDDMVPDISSVYRKEKMRTFVKSMDLERHTKSNIILNGLPGRETSLGKNVENYGRGNKLNNVCSRIRSFSTDSRRTHGLIRQPGLRNLRFGRADEEEARSLAQEELADRLQEVLRTFSEGLPRSDVGSRCSSESRRSFLARRRRNRLASRLSLNESIEGRGSSEFRKYLSSRGGKSEVFHTSHQEHRERLRKCQSEEEAGTAMRPEKKQSLEDWMKSRLLSNPKISPQSARKIEEWMRKNKERERSRSRTSETNKAAKENEITRQLMENIWKILSHNRNAVDNDLTPVATALTRMKSLLQERKRQEGLRSDRSDCHTRTAEVPEVKRWKTSCLRQDGEDEGKMSTIAGSKHVLIELETVSEESSETRTASLDKISEPCDLAKCQVVGDLDKKSSPVENDYQKCIPVAQDVAESSKKIKQQVKRDKSLQGDALSPEARSVLSEKKCGYIADEVLQMKAADITTSKIRINTKNDIHHNLTTEKEESNNNVTEDQAKFSKVGTIHVHEFEPVDNGDVRHTLHPEIRRLQSESEHETLDKKEDETIPKSTINNENDIFQDSLTIHNEEPESGSTIAITGGEEFSNVSTDIGTLEFGLYPVVSNELKENIETSGSRQGQEKPDESSASMNVCRVALSTESMGTVESLNLSSRVEDGSPSFTEDELCEDSNEDSLKGSLDEQLVALFGSKDDFFDDKESKMYKNQEQSAGSGTCEYLTEIKQQIDYSDLDYESSSAQGSELTSIESEIQFEEDCRPITLGDFMSKSLMASSSQKLSSKSGFLTLVVDGKLNWKLVAVYTISLLALGFVAMNASIECPLCSSVLLRK